MSAVSIRRQLQLLILLILLLLGLIWLADSHFEQQTGAGSQARQQLLELELGLITLRLNERDFVASKNPAHLQAFVQRAGDYDQQLSDLRMQLEELGLTRAPLDSLQQAVDAYRDSFQQLVSKQHEIGLDQQSGLYGALARQAQHIELAVRADAGIYAALLLLRRHEKDFMLRRSDAYYTHFMTALSDLRGTLIFADMAMEDLADIQAALRAYVEAFDALSQQEREIGLTPQQGLHGEMAARIKDAETALAQLRAQLSSAINQHMRSSELASTLIVATSMLLVAALLTWLARQLTRRLGGTARSASRLAAGDWQQPIDCDHNDELGAVQQALDAMRLELLARNRRIEQDNRRRRHQAELAMVLQGIKSTEQLAEHSLRQLTPALGCQVGALYLADEESLQFAAGYGIAARDIRRRCFAIGEGLPGQCARNQQITRIHDTPADYLSVVSATGSTAPTLLLLAPLCWQGRLYAVLELATLTPGTELEDDALLTSLGEMIAIALHTASTREALLAARNMPAPAGEHAATTMRRQQHSTPA